MKVNEADGFLEQISPLYKGDIIIFDRNYHSQKLVKALNNNDMGYIFRMKCTSTYPF